MSVCDKSFDSSPAFSEVLLIRSLISCSFWPDCSRLSPDMDSSFSSAAFCASSSSLSFLILLLASRVSPILPSRSFSCNRSVLWPYSFFWRRPDTAVISSRSRFLRVWASSTSPVRLFRRCARFSSLPVISSISRLLPRRFLFDLKAPPVMEPPGLRSSPSRVTRRRE